jgi:hypothetical protein
VDTPFKQLNMGGLPGFLELRDEIHVAHCRLDRAEILLELNLPEHAFVLGNLAEKGFVLPD